jgi:hypothetical protein
LRRRGGQAAHQPEYLIITPLLAEDVALQKDPIRAMDARH